VKNWQTFSKFQINCGHGGTTPTDLADCTAIERFHMTSRQPYWFQNKETAAMLVYQTNPLKVELFSYVNTSFCLSKFACVLAT